MYKIKKYQGVSFLLILSLFVTSCTKEVDFNQANNLVLEPVAVSDLIFFKANANQFFIEDNSGTTIKDSLQIDLFSRDFIVDHVVKAEFVFETTNSINREISVKIDFYEDNSNSLKHSFTLNVEASPTNTDVVALHTEVFENDSLIALKQTNKIVLTIKVLSGDSPLNTDPGRIHLKSNGIFYLKIQ